MRAHDVSMTDRGDYQIDHLIPLEIGGADDNANLSTRREALGAIDLDPAGVRETCDLKVAAHFPPTHREQEPANAAHA